MIKTVQISDVLHDKLKKDALDKKVTLRVLVEGILERTLEKHLELKNNKKK